jgi:hypothetical protein
MIAMPVIMAGMGERTTTITVYWDDLAWLRQRQRTVSFEREKTVTTPDLVRELIKAIREAEAGA